LNRYTAVTVSTSVYDVLNTLTSDTNGTPPTPDTDAATGSVTVSAARNAEGRRSRTPKAHAGEDGRKPLELITKKSMSALGTAIPVSSLLKFLFPSDTYNPGPP
jgi:hypothetical protein